MRRLLLVLALVVMVVAGAALPAAAAPANGKSATILEMDCDDARSLTVLVQFDSNSVAMFDLEANGRRYVMSSLDFRVYEGELDPEPGEDPIFAETKSWGKRNGYGEPFGCSGSDVREYGGVTYTAFFDVELKEK